MSLNKSSIFISCGEVSGDMYAANFTRELLALLPELRGRVWGMTGPLTDAARGDTGDLPHWSYEELKIMGIAEVIPALPRIFRLRRSMIRAVTEINPAAAVLTDSPDYHLPLASGLRSAGYKGKIICLITPTVWAWRSGRTKTLKSCFDLCFPLFSFEHKFLTERGVNSAWTSHPLVFEMRDFRAPADITDMIGSDRAVALMPGSRRREIADHLDALIGAAEIMRGEGFRPIFSSSPGLSQDLKDELAERLRGFEIYTGEGRALMAACEAVAGVSGTVAVEAMLLRRFMTVIYRLNKATYAVLKRLVRVKNISMPNMLEGGHVYPELLCGEANPRRIADEMLRYLNDASLRADIAARLELARSSMGSGSAAHFWAEKTANLIRN